MRLRIAVATAVAAIIPAIALAACGARTAATPDTFATWQAAPLPPDPALTAIAIGPNSPCVPSDEGDPPPPLQVFVQDRRTESTAGFLIASPGRFCSAIVTLAGGMAGSGIGPALEPATGPLTIDANSGGTAGATFVSQLGGRVAIPAARVVVALADGRSVTASMASGFWLTWWPGTTEAEKVIALDDAGAELFSIEVIEP